MEGELAVTHSQAVAPVPMMNALTATEIRARVNRLQEVMKAVMKEGVHFGTIPGTPKPTLLKPGAEQVLVTFRLAAGKPFVDDLSTTDEIRYRIGVPAYTQEVQSVLLGVGVGECSSNEEKYKWRKPVCDEEWNEAPEDRRREKWFKGSRGDKPYKAKQIRTNPADVANTVLKMAHKRAFVAMTLLVTAASDVFSQDIEDMPEEIRETVAAAEVDVPFKEPEPEAPKPGNGNDGGRLMTSRMDGSCKKCGKPIMKGTEIYYLPGTGAFHPSCHA